MLTLRLGDETKVVGAVLGVVAEDLSLEGEPDASRIMLTHPYHVGPCSFLFSRIAIAMCVMNSLVYVINFSHLSSISTVP